MSFFVLVLLTRQMLDDALYFETTRSASLVRIGSTVCPCLRCYARISFAFTFVFAFAFAFVKSRERTRRAVLLFALDLHVETCTKGVLHQRRVKVVKGEFVFLWFFLFCVCVWVT